MIALAVFFLLNFLLFIPRYFFNKETATFFPVNEIFSDNKVKISKLSARFNNDIFRVNLEFSILVLLLLLCKNSIPIYVSIIVFSIFYIITLLVFYYHYSIYSIYKTYPAISTDYKLIQQGISIAYNGYKTALFLGIIVFVGFLFFVNSLISYLVTLIYATNTTLLLLCTLAIIGLTIAFSIVRKVNFFKFNKEFDFHYLQYFTVQITTLILLSNRYFNTKTKEDVANIPNLVADNKIEIPDSITLQKKPNIYFIAIESYGAILYENKIYQEKYKVLANEIYQKLSQNNWHVATTLSTSPVSGGGSWMSYSSFLKGIDIKTDSLYRNLVAQRQKYPAQSLFNILENFGYNNYLVAAIGGFENFKIDWAETLEFLGTKNVIRYKDLDYHGERFNLGPSAPDQYMLNKSIQIMKEKHKNEPISFFVETINSHYKFHSPTTVFQDWKQCNEAKPEDFKPINNLENNQIENYFSAIEYQLKTIEDVIKNEDSDAVFVVFGDHQPPIITNHLNTFETPLHIISKNKDFVATWLQDGFVNSMFLENQNSIKKINHSNFKKLFTTAFIKEFQSK